MRPASTSLHGLVGARSGVVAGNASGRLARRLFPTRLWILLVLSSFISGCTPQLIAHRNQQVLDDTRALQKQTDLFLIKLERACGQMEGNYTSNTTHYDELKAAASSLQVAVDAIPKNSLTSQQVALLRNDYEKLEELHKIGCKPAVLESSRTLLNIHFTALLTLEEAKAN